MKHHEHHHDWSHLDDPSRPAWQKPEAVIATLGLFDGAIVADIGAGTGFFTRLLSHAVGSHGRVLALETDPHLVEQLRQRHAALTNVEVQLVSSAMPQLAQVDRIMVVDVWHHLVNRVAYARRLRDALRAGGRLLIVDYGIESLEGPPRQMRVSADAVVRELRDAGFASVRVDHETLPRQFIVLAE